MLSAIILFIFTQTSQGHFNYILKLYLIFHHILTYLRSWALLEKLQIVQLLKNFPAF
jgi:hypothetical protein